MWLRFYLWPISPDEYVVNVAETVAKQITVSQEILLNSIISFSETGFSGWSWRKKITFNIHLNWKASEYGGWEPINSTSVTSLLFSPCLAVSSFQPNRKLSIVWGIWLYKQLIWVVPIWSLSFFRDWAPHLSLNESRPPAALCFASTAQVIAVVWNWPKVTLKTDLTFPSPRLPICKVRALAASASCQWKALRTG